MDFNQAECMATARALALDKLPDCVEVTLISVNINTLGGVTYTVQYKTKKERCSDHSRVSGSVFPGSDIYHAEHDPTGALVNNDRKQKTINRYTAEQAASMAGLTKKATKHAL